MPFFTIKKIGYSGQIITALIALFFIPAFTPALYAAIYYVDATSGGDINNGLSRDTAWKSIAKVNASQFNSGDQILFKRGETWREKLVVPSSGSSRNPIIFGAFGSGNAPEINGSDLVTSWQYGGSDNVWYSTFTSDPLNVYFDGTLGTKKASKATLAAPHDWYWDSNVLYVYGTADPSTTYTSPGIEGPKRGYGVYVGNIARPYITFDGLKIKNTLTDGIYAYGSTSHGWHILNCTIEHVNKSAIRASGLYRSEGSLQDWIIENNTIGAIDRTADGSGWAAGVLAIGTHNFIIRNNTFNTANSWCIFVSDGDMEGGGSSSIGVQIYNNECSNCISGISVARTIGTILIHHNHIHDGKGMGIGVQNGTNGAQIYYNLIHNLMAFSTILYNGIDINHGAVNGMVYNNTIYAVAGDCITVESHDAESTGWTVKNNIFDASANTLGWTHREPIWVMTGSTVSLSNNIYVPYSGGYVGSWHEALKNLASWNTASGDTRSLDSVPKFISTSTQDFHLQSSSPAIRAGTDVGLTRDYEGNSVIAPPNIGAYDN